MNEPTGIKDTTEVINIDWEKVGQQLSKRGISFLLEDQGEGLLSGELNGASFQMKIYYERDAVLSMTEFPDGLVEEFSGVLSGVIGCEPFCGYIESSDKKLVCREWRKNPDHWDRFCQLREDPSVSDLEYFDK